MERVLLFGGSFDPVHHGHLIIARAVAEHLNISRTLLIPGAVPPHKQERRLAPAADRLAMCRLAISSDPLFEVSDWELGQPGPNYTLNTVAHFRAQFGSSAELYWLIGMDSLIELESWHRASALVDACTIVTAVRPGFAPPSAAELGRCFAPPQVESLIRHCIRTPHIEIAAREVRARVRAGRSIRYLVPEPVREHIERRGLYRTD